MSLGNFCRRAFGVCIAMGVLILCVHVCVAMIAATGYSLSWLSGYNVALNVVTDGLNNRKANLRPRKPRMTPQLWPKALLGWAKSGKNEARMRGRRKEQIEVVSFEKKVRKKAQFKISTPC